MLAAGALKRSVGGMGGYAAMCTGRSHGHRSLLCLTPAACLYTASSLWLQASRAWCSRGSWWAWAGVARCARSFRGCPRPSGVCHPDGTLILPRRRCHTLLQDKPWSFGVMCGAGPLETFASLHAACHKLLLTRLRRRCAVWPPCLACRECPVDGQRSGARTALARRWLLATIMALGCSSAVAFSASYQVEHAFLTPGSSKSRTDVTPRRLVQQRV